VSNPISIETRKLLALLLCCQPVFWMSNTALAQTLQQVPGTLGSSPFGTAGTASQTSGMQQGSAPEAGLLERSASSGSRGTQPPVDQVVDPETWTYVCGPGDLLDLAFRGLQNFRHRVSIDLEGRAFIPKIGYVSLSGRTLSRVRASLRESMGRYYPNLAFDLALVEPRTFLAQAVGEVVRPGSDPARAVERVASLLIKAGGLAPSATRHMPVAVVRRSATDAQDLTLRPFTEGESVRTLLERVGGVGPLADLGGSYLLRNGKSIPVDLHALVMLKDLKADRPVQLGDTLVVPFKRRSILVQGAVFAPGPYPFNPTFGVEQYLALAGGRNRYALELDEVRLVTSNGETTMFRKDLQVEPGSALVVPERNFTRAELVGIGLSVSGILIAVATLYVTARK
jgi:protein involved in polysaccharide export with SLBB domain